jgi:hypothetical protein
MLGVTAAIALPLLFTACATPPPAQPTISEDEARAAFLRGCTRTAARQGPVTAQHRAACECGWRVVRRHMTVDEIAALGMKSREKGGAPDDPKFRRAVAEMGECRQQ